MSAQEIVLYSATSINNLPSIIAERLRSGSYWANNTDVTDYYCETIADEDETPVVLEIRLSLLAPAFLAPDKNGIEEPLTYTLGKTEDEIREAWDNSGQTWQDCLELIKSLRYDAVIPAEHLMIEDDDGCLVALDEFYNQTANI